MNCILSGNFLTKKPIYKSALEIYAAFQLGYVIFITAVADYLPNIGCWDIFIERNFSEKISTIYIICSMY